MTEDHFTHTETDAGLYEFRRHGDVYGYYRPTKAELDREEQDAIDLEDARRKEEL